MVLGVGISTRSGSVAILCVDASSSGMTRPLTLSSGNGTDGDSASMIVSIVSIVSGFG